MTVHVNPYRCWEVEFDDEYAEHHQTEADAKDAALMTAPHRPVRELDRPCAGATCDECGADYEDPGTGSPVHLADRDTVLDRIDAADWTTDEMAAAVHCEDCPPLPERPLRWTTGAAAGFEFDPLPGL